MDFPQRFCVRWNSYKSNLQTAFPKLLTSEHFVDVTLACEKQYLKCHKVVLSACSFYFEDLLVNNPCPHPIIFMKDIAFWEMKALVEFMYKGEVSVSQEQLDSLLKSAESLQIRGLSGAKKSTDAPEVEPKKRKKTSEDEEAKSVQITTCDDKDETKSDADLNDASDYTDKHSDIKEEATLEVDDSAYMDPTDDEETNTYHSDEIYQDSSREAGPSGIADLTSLALNSVECVMEHDGNRPKDEYNDRIADHNYTNIQQEGDESHSTTHAPKSVPSLLAPVVQIAFRRIEPKPQGSVPTLIPATPAAASAPYVPETRPRAIRKDAFNRIRRSEAELGKAAEMVRGGMTFQTASDTFNIPISTIRFYMARRGILPQRRRGRGSSGQRDDDLMHPPFEIVHYRLPDIDKPV